MDMSQSLSLAPMAVQCASTVQHAETTPRAEHRCVERSLDIERAKFKEISFWFIF